MILALRKTVLRLDCEVVRIKISVLSLIRYYRIDHAVAQTLKLIVPLFGEQIRRPLYPFGDVGIPENMRLILRAPLAVQRVETVSFRKTVKDGF